MPEKEPDSYAVVGNPISHSKSPLIHSQFASQTDQHIFYSAELVEKNQFTAFVSDFFENGGKGLNVTVPFKVEAFEFVDQLSDRARLAGAVNTLFKKTVNCKTLIIGDNTDGVGLVNDITDNLGWAIKNKQILLLGAGGAVRGVLQPLLDNHPASITIANRTVEKAQQLADTFNNAIQVTGCGYDALSDQGFDLIINGTAASLANELPPLQASIMKNNCCCYDMMYSKEPTLFMQWATENGCKQVADGLGMLVEQAAESFFIWRGVKPKTAPVIQQLRQL